MTDNQKHTPGPWRWEPDNYGETDVKNSDYRYACIVSKNPNIKHTESYILGVDRDYDSAWLEISEANAQRITDCVNAMQGIDDPEDWVEKIHNYLIEIRKPLQDGMYAQFLVDEALALFPQQKDIQERSEDGI